MIILDPNADKYFKGLLGKTGDNTYQVPRIDTTSHVLKNISIPHSSIHGKLYFDAHHTLTGKNDGTYLTIYMLTPDTEKEIHMWAKWTASGAAFFRIREYPAVTLNTGTTGPTFNRNRRIPIPDSTVWDNTTVRIQGAIMTDVTINNRAEGARGVNGGVFIWEEYDGIGKQFMGGNRESEERVLERNMAYVYEIESDAAALILSLQLGWYERIPKGK